MKKLSILFIFSALSFALLKGQEKNDTTINFNQKRYEISDKDNQVRVKVFKTDNDTIEHELSPIYEAVFSDNQSVETYSIESKFEFNFPMIKRKRRSNIHGHFEGMQIGRLYSTDAMSQFDEAGGVALSKSNEIAINPISATVTLIPRFAGITTGIGVQWQNMHVGQNMHFVNNNGITEVEPAPEGIDYRISRLRTFNFTLPIYLELQPTKKDRFFLSGGILFGVNAYTSNKVKYRDPVSNTKIKIQEGKEYNINPFSISYVAQIGWDDYGIYAKYTPTSFFKSGKGFDFQTFSVGIAFYSF